MGRNLSRDSPKSLEPDLFGGVVHPRAAGDNQAADEERECECGMEGGSGDRERHSGGRECAIFQLFAPQIVEAVICIFDCSGNHLLVSVQRLRGGASADIRNQATAFPLKGLDRQATLEPTPSRVTPRKSRKVAVGDYARPSPAHLGSRSGTE